MYPEVMEKNKTENLKRSFEGNELTEGLKDILEVKVSPGVSSKAIKDLFLADRVINFVITPGLDCFVSNNFHNTIYYSNGLEMKEPCIEGRIREIKNAKGIQITLASPVSPEFPLRFEEIKPVLRNKFRKFLDSIH